MHDCTKYIGFIFSRSAGLARERSARHIYSLQHNYHYDFTGMIGHHFEPML